MRSKKGYCNCIIGDEKKIGTFRLVNICEEGTCVHCGYFTSNTNHTREHIKSQKLRKARNARDEKILELLDQGVPNYRISELLEISTTVISQCRTKHYY